MTVDNSIELDEILSLLADDVVVEFARNKKLSISVPIPACGTSSISAADIAAGSRAAVRMAVLHTFYRCLR